MDKVSNVNYVRRNFVTRTGHLILLRDNAVGVCVELFTSTPYTSSRLFSLIVKYGVVVKHHAMSTHF
jgi:hypothetical protein